MTTMSSDTAIQTLKANGFQVGIGGDWYGPVYYVSKDGRLINAYGLADLIRLLPRLLNGEIRAKANNGWF